MVPSYAILPATVSSIMLQGSAEKLFSIEFAYGDFFIANFPALALPATLIAILLLIYLFREPPSVQPATPPSRPLTAPEIRTLAIAAGAVLLWATDHVHGLPVSLIAIGAATVCVLPVVGPMRDISVFRFMRPRIWVLMIGVLGAVTLLNMTGLSEIASVYVVERLGFSHAQDGFNYAVFVLLAMILSFVFTVQAAPAIFATLAKDMGLATGWPIEGVLMVQVAAWVFLVFPYTAPALLIGMRTCGLRYRPVLTFLMLYFVIGVCAVLPLQFWWLRQLGYIP
jgi:hypothetical protein